jgi:hypothetical protein
MDRQLRNVLESVLKMLKALGEHMSYLNENDSLSDHPHCWQLIEDIRNTCMDVIGTLNIIERRIQASGLRPPKEE